MKKEMSLDYLDDRLRRAARLLDGSARLIRRLDLDPDKNVRRVAEALANVFEIQHQIYRRRPDLMPDFLREALPQDESGR